MIGRVIYTKGKIMPRESVEYATLFVAVIYLEKGIELPSIHGMMAWSRYEHSKRHLRR